MVRSWKHHIYRPQVLKRDNYACVKCNKVEQGFIVDSFGNKWKQSSLVVDHIIPIALGGDEFSLSNMQTLCRECNNIKNAQDQSNISKAKQKVGGISKP